MPAGRYSQSQTVCLRRAAEAVRQERNPDLIRTSQNRLDNPRLLTHKETTAYTKIAKINVRIGVEV